MARFSANSVSIVVAASIQGSHRPHTSTIGTGGTTAVSGHQIISLLFKHIYGVLKF